MKLALTISIVGAFVGMVAFFTGLTIGLQSNDQANASGAPDAITQTAEVTHSPQVKASGSGGNVIINGSPAQVKVNGSGGSVIVNNSTMEDDASAEDNASGSSTVIVNGQEVHNSSGSNMNIDGVGYELPTGGGNSITVGDGVTEIKSGGHQLEVSGRHLQIDRQDFGPIPVGAHVRLDSSGGVFVNGVVRRAHSRN